MLAGEVGWEAMGCVRLYPLGNLGHAWERGGLGSPPESPPSLRAGRDFSKEQQGRCQIQKEFGPNSLEIPAYGFFFFSSPPFLFTMRICKVLGCSLHPRVPWHPVLLPRGRNSPRKSPLSSPRLLQASKKLPLEIRSPFKFRCLHYLEFGFINYLHLVRIKKS